MDSATRESVEKCLVRHREALETAEARATQAAQSLQKFIIEIDYESCEPQRIRAAADDFAGSVQELRHERAIVREIRGLLM